VNENPADMKIGVDAKWLHTGNVSGRLFIQNILPELFALHPKIEWHIFLNKNSKRLGALPENENINIHYVWAEFNMISNLFILPKYAKLLNLDAVLFQTFSPKGKSFKSIVFIHDVLFRTYPEYFTWKEKLYFLPLRWTAPLADRIVTTTEFVKRELIRLHYSKEHDTIDLAPSGVTNVFKPGWQHDRNLLNKIKEKRNLPDSYLLFVGRLNARKNIQGILRALPLLDDKNISLVIVGEKDWKPPYKKDVYLEKILNSRVHFTGAIPDNELACIYASAKIFCFPSFAEGFGLPPLEAMASGIPAIVSNNTSMPEVCQDAALFVDPHNPSDIAEKINQLLKNPVLYQQKIKEGLKWSSLYTWKRTAEGIMKSIFTAVENGKT
jgi:glycosyltransferase involved in cell wall biosynthesis